MNINRLLPQRIGFSSAVQRLRRSAPSWQTNVLGLVVVSAIVVAFSVDGYRSAKLNLDDGGVWITSSQRGRAGRVNTQIGQMDGVSPSISPSIDVLQNAKTVLLVDPDSDAVSILDTSTVTKSPSIELPADTSVQMGASVVTILGADGKLWVRSVTDLGAFDKKKTKPTKTAAAGSRVAVGVDGSLALVDPTAQTITPIGGRSGGDDSGAQALKLAGDSLQTAIFGGRVAVLSNDADDATAALQIGDRTIDLSEFGTNGVLGESSDSDRVLVATDTHLISIPADGDADPTVLSDKGTGGAARPVDVATCAYGAWTSTPSEVIACDGATPSAGPIELPPNSKLKFRVNAQRVVLNAWEQGEAFVAVDGQFIRVDNWNDVIPQTDTTKTTDPDQSSEGDDENCSQSDTNQPPTATEDQAGARPGVATLIPVLANDRDPECDVMTVTEIRSIAPADAAQIDIVDRGQSIQLTSEPGFTGEITFDYLVSDGWNEPVLGHATVVVKGFDAPNGKPTQKKGGSRVAVAKSETVTYNVLPDFVDPDGDPLILVSASIQDGATGTLRSGTDGTITYVDDGTSTTERKVLLEVSDGRDTVAGLLVIKVEEELNPIARNDHATGVVGQRLSIPVLANDTGSGGDSPFLVSADQATGGASVAVDLASGMVSFTSATSGTFHFLYSMTAGGKVATAQVRVDIIEPGENKAPIAVRDHVTVAVGGTAVLDIIANDTDPNNDVLTVTTISPPAGSGLTVALLEHRALRITASQLETGPITISYTVSDGVLTDEGQVVVQTIASSIVNRPPTAVDDVAVVRAGDVVSVAVLANDTDPDGDRLTLSPTLTWNTPDGLAVLGEAFTDRDIVRFAAGDSPGYVALSYSVTDTVGQTSSALVRINVRGADEANEAPIPRSVDARAFAGSAVTIQIPTLGVDPDGDSVTLRTDLAPKQGILTQTDPTACSCFIYEALESARGTDTFTYVATDPFGASGRAIVRVGVAERPAVNQAPIVVDDKVQARPGRSIIVDALANDSDPDGDVFGFDPSATFEPDHGATAEIRSGRIAVSTTNPGVATFNYSVLDARGATANGYLTVDISDAAPLIAPIARDDPPPAVKEGDLAVDIDLLSNDEDPDGTVGDLTVSVAPTAEAKVRDGKTLRATLGNRPRIVVYTITDPDGLTASAIARIPAVVGGTSAVNQPPVLTGKDTYDVLEGVPLDIDVADIVTDPEGGSVIITEQAKLSAVNGTLEWIDATNLRFTSAPEYSGPASLSFEVTDGTDPADAAGAKATFTLKLTVTGKTNTPPEFTPPAIDIGSGDDERSIELRPFAKDPDPGDLETLQFGGLSGAGNGLNARIEGSTLVVAADATLKKGEQRSLTLTVTDSKNQPVPAQIQVRVVASNRPKAKANDDVVANAKSGQPSEIQVLDNDQAPVGLGPIRVTGVSVPPGLGTASFGSDTVTFTPDPKWDGTASLQYTINDVLDDPDRIASGTITVTVRNRPDAPSAPVVTEYGSRLVVLTWPAPNNHGGVIDRYEVTATDGSIPAKDCGSATTCRLDSLENNHKYTFKVRAHNEVDWSPLSAASVEVTPDTRPNKPTAAPILAFVKGLAGGELNATWTAPVNEGSPIINYQLELSPPPSGGQPALQAGTTLSVKLTGLTNGTGYRLRYRAKNSSKNAAKSDDGWSDWSELSVPETPAAPPAAPAKPAAARVDSPAGGQVRVAWAAPQTNGAAITEYTVNVYDQTAPNVVSRSIKVTDGSNQTVAATTPNRDYTFTIIASNKAGDSPPSVASDAVHDFQKPDKPQTPVADATGENGTLYVSGTSLAYMASVGNGGQAITQFEVQVSPGGILTRNPQVEMEWPISGLSNGTPYTFKVRAFNGYWSDWSDTSAPVSPFGPPGAPSVSAAHIGGNTIRLHWDPPAANGRPVDAMQISVDGGGWTSVALSGDNDVNTGYSATHTIRARAASQGQWGAPSGTASAKAPDPPPRSVSVYPGPRNSYTSGTCTVNRCRIVGVSLRNFFPAGSQHTINCDWAPTYGIASVTVTVDANGNADGLTKCFLGNDNVSAIVDGQAWGPWYMTWWDT